MHKILFHNTLRVSCKTFRKNDLTPRKAFAFNVQCMMLIERKLNEGNAVGLADELIEFYMYVLTEKKRPLLKHQR